MLQPLHFLLLPCLGTPVFKPPAPTAHRHAPALQWRLQQATPAPCRGEEQAAAGGQEQELHQAQPLRALQHQVLHFQYQVLHLIALLALHAHQPQGCAAHQLQDPARAPEA